VPMYTEIVLCKYELYQTKTYMCCVPWSPMSVIWWRSSKVSD
jgi:hypothetical protein